MTAIYKPSTRFAVIDFEGTHLPFVIAIAERLKGRADFVFFVDRPDVGNLLRENRSWDVRMSPPSSALDDAQLLEACGRHEPLWARDTGSLLREARHLASCIELFYRETAPNQVLIWNGVRGLAGSIAAWLARRMGIKPLFFENGYLPGTMQISFEGVNAFSPFTAAVQRRAYKDFAVDDDALAASLSLLKRGQPPPDRVPVTRPTLPASRRAIREARRIFSASAWRWLWSFNVPRPRRTLPADIGRFVLLPMQVVKDSQLSVHSPLFGFDRERLVLEVALALRRALPNMKLVVKLHPKELAHENRALLRLSRRLPDVVFLHGGSIPDLLGRTEMVVTVNSTAGIEAMAFNKSIVTLGRNLYITEHLVHPVQHLDELDSVLRRAAADGARASGEIRSFLGYLQQEILTQGSHNDLSERSLSAIEARLIRLTGMDARSSATHGISA